MSIARMVRLGIERQQERNVPTAKTAAEEGKGAKKALDSAMEKVTSFIPSEVIGIYVAGLGILTPVSDRGKWLIFFIASALVPIFIWLNWLREKKHAAQDTTVLPTKSVIVLIVLGEVAFTAWAAALPGTPFLSLTEYAMKVGGLSVVILAAVLYYAADLLDVVPKGS